MLLHASCDAEAVCISGQVVNVLGFNITGEECVVLVRAGGEYLPATCLPLDPALAAYVSTMNLELVHLQVNADPNFDLSTNPDECFAEGCLVDCLVLEIRK